MISMLLVIIYLSFISLGLPDSLLGSAWPVMHLDLGVSESIAGVVTMIISFGTIVSSLQSDRLTHKYGAGKVTAVSVFMTAAALFGFSISGKFWQLCLWAIPYGLGAGAVDAALNNFVALHYTSRQMSWLHCCWGLGASISPYIMGAALTGGMGWHGGYRMVSIIQVVLSAVIFLSLPQWKKTPKLNTDEAADRSSKKITEESEEKLKTESEINITNKSVNEAGTEISDVPVDDGPIPLREVIRIPGAMFVFIMFFAYCAMEQTTMLWASSYMVGVKSVPTETAARFAALFTIGITIGRFISGFISNRLGDRNMIRLGAIVAGVGIVMITLPIEGTAFAIMGLIVLGIGCGPIYPSIIHSTPANFGADKSQAIVGMQMASAYVGTTFMAPFFGVVSRFAGIGSLPIYLFAFFVLMLVMSSCLNRTVDRARK